MYRHSFTISISRIITYLYIYQTLSLQQILDIDCFHEDLDEDIEKALRTLLDAGIVKKYRKDNETYYKLTPKE